MVKLREYDSISRVDLQRTGRPKLKDNNMGPKKDIQYAILTDILPSWDRMSS